LVYPDGLVYDPENRTVRTKVVNPIFDAINSISTTIREVSENSSGSESEKLRQVYLTFPSSNFFWNSLGNLNTQIIDFQTNYQKVWEDVFLAYPSPATGLTEARVFRYSSSQTGGMPNFGFGEVGGNGNWCI
jgi:hypothetical protein